tara:strand:- start:1568 stop:2392 length:825 start_codon:yes stop_codon:yes gene_type:complete
MGGFGNQIFQFCKAKDFQNLGFIITIDTSNYARFKGRDMYPNIHREQVVPISYFGFQETPDNIKSIYKNLQKAEKIHFLPSLLNPSKEINDQNIHKAKFKKYNKAIGYWQDVSLIKKYKNFVIQSLSKDEGLLKGFNSEVATGSTLLHVRRGDYVNLNENLNDIFYKKSLDYCKNNIESFNYEIFTDDYEWVKSNKIFKDANYIHSDNISVENTIKSFGKMINNENFVIGNSTFPLIAAVLSEKENSKVIVADPWFKNKRRDLNLPGNWIKIKR